MKNNRRILISILWIVLGIGLNVACLTAGIDAFWSGLGTGFIFVGVLQLLRWIKYFRSAQYREKMDVESKDERNRYLSMKAWSWAGYLFVIVCAVLCIVARLLGQVELSMMASGGICLIIVLYWLSHLILKRKY